MSTVTTKIIDIKALIDEVDPPEPERTAYEFSNGREFKEDDTNGVYDDS